jgi:hypothetical protein
MAFLHREGISRNGWQPMADALLTMNVRRGPTDAGFRLAARVVSPRGSPRLVAFCAAVRPWCDPLHPGHSAARQAVRLLA